MLVFLCFFCQLIFHFFLKKNYIIFWYCSRHTIIVKGDNSRIFMFLYNIWCVSFFLFISVVKTISIVWWVFIYISCKDHFNCLVSFYLYQLWRPFQLSGEFLFISVMKTISIVWWVFIYISCKDHFNCLVSFYLYQL